MARVTIEDCIKEIDNTFDICTLASKRAKDLASGAASSIESKSKPSVLALKEIAEKKVGLDYFEVSNKQLADSKLFSEMNEQEIVDELNQHVDTSNQADPGITEKSLIESSENQSGAEEDTPSVLDVATDQPITEESAAITSETITLTEEPTQSEIPEDIDTDSPENKS